jgi:plasmid stability protein
MVKTTVYLPEDLKTRLERTAAAEGRSEAEIVRAALDRYTAPTERPRPHLPLFESLGDPGLSERVPEELAKGFGRD